MASEWQAAEALNEAVGKTRELLFSKNKLGLWLKLAVLVFLIGGGIRSFNPGSGFGQGKTSGGSDVMATIAPYLPYIIIGIAVLLVIALVFSFIRAVCQFIFIESLSKGSVELVKGFRRNIDSGFNLFLFNLAFILATIAIIVLLAAPVIYIAVKNPEGFTDIGMIAAVLATVFAELCFIIPATIISSLTNDFAIAFVYSERRGILDGWQRLWALVKKNVKQFMVYLVVKFAVGIIAGIIAFMVGFIVMLLALIFIIVIGLGAALVVAGIALALGISESALLWLLIPAAIIAIAYLILVSYGIVVLTLPIPVFFRYYSLLFLQRMEPTLDLIRTTTDKTDESGEKIPEEEGENKAAKIEAGVKEEKPKGRKKKAGELKVY